jgi:nicotinamidase-related amidase
VSDEGAGVDALILVDLQRGFLEGPAALPRADDLTDNVKTLLARARASGALVVHVQNDGPWQAVDEPFSPGWDLALPQLPGEPVLRKQGDDAFAGTALGNLLQQHGIARIALAGLQSEMCVAATARTALSIGFGVVLPHDSHGTYDVPPGVGFDRPVPAEVVARIAEWSLGDRLEILASADDVRFTSRSR